METTQDGLHLVEPYVGDLKSLFSIEEVDVSRQDLSTVRKFIERLLEKLGGTEILDALRDTQVDILGAYYFHVPVIHLYWIPVVVVADILGVSAESLAAVTLLHERAHAYTHRGFDADGNQWPTQAFAETDLEVVEGLAQYYTWRVCVSIKEKYPSLLEAFNKLLDLQPRPYRAFEMWDHEGERAGEVIRRALITARARPTTDAFEFEGMLRDIRKQHQTDE